GQARSSLAAVRALAAAGYRPAVTVSGRFSIAAASRHSSRSLKVPPVGTPGYAEAVQAELAERYLTVLPASDAALLALGAPVDHLVDKVLLAQGAARAGLQMPPSRAFASTEALLSNAEGLDYPIVLKPSVKTTASPSYARRVVSAAELSSAAVGGGPFVVQPYISDYLHAVAGIAWKGELVAALHQRYLRTWPRDCGVACAAQTVEPDENLEGHLVRLLDGYNGIFQAQFAGNYLLDLNPRVYGSLPLAVAAGVNLPGLYCALVSGKRVAPVRARTGVFFRWIEGDLRHAWSAIRERDKKVTDILRDLRPHRRTAHSTESFTDPGPMLSRLLYALWGRADTEGRLVLSGFSQDQKPSNSDWICRPRPMDDRSLRDQSSHHL
ncbi:MAG: ATP-grasp domain-containing protein, partial [Actinomycetota bacterium]|nr:ATP-grasp domain-containing protein [Actinomycetota bacterium]